MNPLSIRTARRRTPSRSVANTPNWCFLAMPCERVDIGTGHFGRVAPRPAPKRSVSNLQVTFTARSVAYDSAPPRLESEFLGFLKSEGPIFCVRVAL